MPRRSTPKQGTQNIPLRKFQPHTERKTCVHQERSPPIKHCDHFPCYRSDHHLLWYQYHQNHHDTCEAQAQVMFSAAVMLVSKPKIGTPVSFATHLHCSWWRKTNLGISQTKGDFSADIPARTTAQTLLRFKHSLRKKLWNKYIESYQHAASRELIFGRTGGTEILCDFM